MARGLSPAYRPRRPTETVIYRVLEQHLGRFFAAAAAADRCVPSFVRAELEGLLTCGVVAHGLAVQACPRCAFHRVVGLACEGRGFCPSCLGRRMAQTAANLVDHVLPEIPYRHYILSLPPPLRFMLAYDAPACSLLLNLFLAEVFAWQKRAAKRELGLSRVADLHGGAVSVLQRAGGSLNVNLHIHSALADGVFFAPGLHGRSGAHGGGGGATQPRPQFLALPPPSQAELDQLAWQLYLRARQVLGDLGKSWEYNADRSDDADDTANTAANTETLALLQREPLLFDCAAASMQGLELFGTRAGQRQLLLGTSAGFVDHEARAGLGRRPRPPHGFDLHASTRVSASDRGGLERMCRYLLRPPLSNDRLELLRDGRVRLAFVRPWQDGTSHVTLDPLTFISRLVALVPPPRAHQIRYHGFLAPRSRLRPWVLPSSARRSDTPDTRSTSAARPTQLPLPTVGEHAGGETRAGPATGAQAPTSASLSPAPAPAPAPIPAPSPVSHPPTEVHDKTCSRSRPQRIAWARLLRRAGGYDMETCPECGAVLRTVECVLSAGGIARVLARVAGMAGSEPCRGRLGAPVPPARGPPNLAVPPGSPTQLDLSLQ